VAEIVEADRWLRLRSVMEKVKRKQAKLEEWRGELSSHSSSTVHQLNRLSQREILSGKSFEVRVFSNNQSFVVIVVTTPLLPKFALKVLRPKQPAVVMETSIAT